MGYKYFDDNDDGGTTTLYTVPADKIFLLYSGYLLISNMSGAYATGRIMVTNAADATLYRVMESRPQIAQSETIPFGFHFPVRLVATNKLKIYSSAAGLYVRAFVVGMELP